MKESSADGQESKVSGVSEGTPRHWTAQLHEYYPYYPPGLCLVLEKEIAGLGMD